MLVDHLRCRRLMFMYPRTTKNKHVTVTEQFFVMPDGVNLYTRIVAPNSPGKFPIVFIRTPYETAHNGAVHNISEYDNNRFIDNGYALVVQHCRGRGDSEGVCVPHHERDDGLNSLELVRKLDIYNGEIYLLGGSSLATVHLCYLDTNPEDIKGAIFKIQTDRMYFRNYRNGCCYNFLNIDWWLGMLDRAYPNPNFDGTVKRPYVDIMKRIIGTDFPAYTDLLINDKYNEFWKSDPRTYVMNNLKIPVLFVDGWYDFYTDGMFNMWERLPQKTRERSAFIVGPWGHATSVSKQAEYPLPNGNMARDYDVEWFNSIRSGNPYKYAPTGQISYYSMGKNTWNTSVYPAASSGKKRLYFGEGNTLNTSACPAAKSISYVYDPEKRVNCFQYLDIYKAAEIGSVDCVISFLSQPFTEDMSFLGKIRWHMNVSSDCDDTAFFMRVYFVENNVAYNLTETITSLSHIDENYKAGETITIDLFTPPIAFAVKRGGQIRVDISSDSGIYVPHANVKGHWAKVTETRIANNTIYLENSFIELNTEQ